MVTYWDAEAAVEIHESQRHALLPWIWTARLNVTLHSPHNRIELAASSFDELFHTIPDIHAQMGELKGGYDKAYAIRSPPCWRQLISNQA